MRTPKKLTALILMGALTASSVAAVPAGAKTFSDVPSNHWAYAVIDEVSNASIMIGTGTAIFSPNSILTRAEYAAVLANLTTDKSFGRFDVTYTDVPADAWYADAAEWVVSRGIYTVKDGKFEPNKPISRELMADMTYKFIYYIYTSHIIPNITSAGYADESSFSSEYAASINALTHNGLLAGRGSNKFEPQGTLTRAEAAAMASRLLSIVEDGSDSEDPSEPSEPVNPGEAEEPNEPSEPENPSETEDPNDPSNWDLDGAPEWFLVGRPDGITIDQWNELITYWADKEGIAHSEIGYPSKVPSIIANEEQAKAHFQVYIERLYDYMKREETIINTIAALENGNTTLSSAEIEHINLVNDARKASSTHSLKISPALCAAAKIRAQEALHRFSHTRPNGSDCQTILNEVGLADYNGTDYDGNSQIQNLVMGENLTMRYKPSLPASDAFDNFMNSPAHKDNLLSSDYQYIGIGYYSNGTYAAWCQIFCYSSLV